MNGRMTLDVLVHVECDERKVEQQRDPLEGEQEEEREEGVCAHFREDELHGAYECLASTLVPVLLTALSLLQRSMGLM